MKILLLGDFSALHKNLKEGLLELGHEAVVAARSDGFKKVPVDISLGSSLPSILEAILKPLTLINKLQGFDVVQLVNPFVFHHKYFPTKIFYRTIKQVNNKFFLLGAGDDAYFWKYGRKSLKYGPFDDFLKYDRGNENFYINTEEAFAFNEKVLNLVNGIIPIAFEYEVSYLNHPKRLPTIPIPVNLNKIKYQENKVGNKLIIFHGLSRYGFKGTRHVEEAFNYLSRKYPNDLELIIDGKMPLNKYLEVMQRTNVVIDQMNSYSLGVNGVYALAMGKITMGGAEPESLKSIGVESSPVINLKPNAQAIIKEVENLLDKRTQIQELGFESRRFAEQVHNHIKVAQQYIETWSKF